MTAADWHKRLWDGGLRFDMWHEVIADLVAVETEAETLGWGCDYWRGQAENAERQRDLFMAELKHDESDYKLERDKAEADRDYLRRKLEETRKYMRHKDFCGFHEMIKDGKYVCTCGLDALLAKLGGGK